ncbi:MAG: hypothetical protein C5S45_09885 [Candidatus Methanocomedens sp.]|nr:MAG: hypothetical protein C5S45_09885 [ANME-2 cluster archaeon]
MGMITLLLLAELAGTGAASPTLSNSGGGSWEDYEEISVQENSGKTLVDFQVLVELSGTNFPLESKPYGIDIRFADENGMELTYWIEEWDYSSKKAIIWVKVQRIPANGETKLLMYYNNPSAIEVSSDEATFNFFDDFDGTEIDESKWHINYGKPSVSDSVLSLNGDCIVSEKVEAFGYDYIFESFSKVSDTGNLPRSLLRSTNDYNILDAKDRFEFGSWEIIDEMLLVTLNDEIFHSNTNNERFPTSFEVLGMTRSSEKIETFRQYDPKITVTKNIPNDQLYLQLYSWGGEIHYIDWVRVRKYTSPEPTVIIEIGNPLSPTPPGTLSIPPGWLLIGSIIIILLLIGLLLRYKRKPETIEKPATNGTVHIHIGDKINNPITDSVIQRSNLAAGEIECSNCGKERESNEKFCHGCGAKL